jgi:glycosyltransferase involved in cell wall biosynthesis
VDVGVDGSYKTEVHFDSAAPAAGRKDFLFVQSTTGFGGAERVLLNLFTASEELRRRGLVVTLGFSGGDLPTRLRAVGADVEELTMARVRQFWRLWPTLRDLRALVRATGARVLIGNGGHPQAVASVVSRLAGVRSAFLVHSIYKPRLLEHEPADIAALTAPCDLMMAVSKSAETAAARLRPRVPTRLLYNGTPIPQVTAAEAQAARAELGVREGELLFGVFGRLQRWKAQDVFVKAAAEIAAQRPNVRFAVVGQSEFGLEPEYAEELRRLADTPALAGRMVFTGFRNDVARLMAACDVVCHTSRVQEPFGLVVIEAMAVGRPVIATAGGGPSEIISSEAEGVLVPADDPGALVRASLALVDDPERRRLIGEKAAARVRAQFSIDVMASTLIRYLDELP